MYKHHSFETKLKVIELYEAGYGSTTIGQRLLVNERRIRSWIYSYRRHGLEGLQKKSHTDSTPEFRCEVVAQVLQKCLSCEQVALEYGISESAVWQWIRKVRAQGYDALNESRPRGRPPKTMGRPKKREPQTELEKLQEENARLRAENALLKKVKALVEAREARLREIGSKPSKN